ncbi:potassium transport protein Kup [Sphingopyxis sp. H038]|uniref:potassium transporter Kup n=1 Tax=unclassified Sphingopyxis TaxID=2614943 RepID=UPI000730E634|nr:MULTISPECIES: potassium transporter Kup [unclassified Sphingopyxis]KTE04479.1 potassium transport protein Kup [Sphingopyxis sp. H012]KTE13321.1 potassium transport protein Kup [Sphingopyxis sp. H053]KTE14508.1 potassium transport protein Kup [Sphingopyxis sp. H093]KTE31160.1 potassium transport protein Kup [Sphingopyxis sp. H080]KTE36968.1 potassium transport protein Kup [Sphingopyxis sp. H038]
MTAESQQAAGGAAGAVTAGAETAHYGHGHHSDGKLKLAVGAIGVVFGDIGTSPLYAFRETFAGHHPIEADRLHIYGVLSLVFWSMMLVVTFKYVLTIMRADNKGEGGSLALLALISRSSGEKRWTWPIILLGVFATALFYGDSMITPAMSVLSATEGLSYVNKGFEPYIVPIALTILIGLFAIQARGTAKVGMLFGPIMLAYFTMLAILGMIHIVDHPGIIVETLNPVNALRFFYVDGFTAFIALGAVVLAVTGAEALYADMGHFGRGPIGLSWLTFVLPALMLNYMGQGAMVLEADMGPRSDLIADPFFQMMPEAWQVPVVILAILATIIASQAVISGAFSLTQQAIQLGFMPRLRVEHTSASAQGQIYIPIVNWGLMVMVIILVLFFGSSSNLAAAYGIAVTGAMFIDTCLLSVVLFTLWKWPAWKALPVLAVFFIVDIAYFGANLIKVPDGGWVPLAIGLIIFTLLTTWSRGRKLMQQEMAEGAMPIPVFVKSAANSATRVPGTAVFMTSSSDGVPHALLHNLKHNKVLHARIILLTIKIADVPFVQEEKFCMLEDLGQGFHRLVLNYGFMQPIDVPEALTRVTSCGGEFKMIETSFFLSRQTLIAASKPGMPIWREKLFAWMLRNSESAMEYFRLPTNRVVELGSQVAI